MQERTNGIGAGLFVVLSVAVRPVMCVNAQTASSYIHNRSCFQIKTVTQTVSHTVNMCRESAYPTQEAETKSGLFSLYINQMICRLALSFCDGVMTPRLCAHTSSPRVSPDHTFSPLPVQPESRRSPLQDARVRVKRSRRRSRSATSAEQSTRESKRVGGRSTKQIIQGF